MKFGIEYKQEDWQNEWGKRMEEKIQGARGWQYSNVVSGRIGGILGSSVIRK